MTDIGIEWYLNNTRNPKPPMNNPRLSKKQKEEEKLKGELKVACDHWKDWKIQIHWKIGILVPLKRNTKRTIFCMSSSKLFLKYGLQYNHWVGQSAMKSVDAVIF